MVVPDLLRPALCRKCGGSGEFADVYNEQGDFDVVRCQRCFDHPGVDPDVVVTLPYDDGPRVVVIPLGGDDG